MSVEIVLAISTDQVLTSNQRRHWADKARRTKTVREMAWVMSKHHRYDTLPPSACVVEVTWPDNRIRDAHNLQPTVKAAIDGFVDAGLLRNDDDTHLRALTFSASTTRRKTAGIACYLRFTFTPVAS